MASLKIYNTTLKRTARQNSRSKFCLNDRNHFTVLLYERMHLTTK